MENKILIRLLLPELEKEFDLFIPVNEVVWKVKLLVLKAISDMGNNFINSGESYVLINKDNSKIYGNNEVIIDTDIRNGTELFLVSASR